MDVLANEPLLLTVEPNGKTYYALNRNVNGQALKFVPAASTELMEDTETHSIWKLNGICIDGLLKGIFHTYKGIKIYLRRLNFSASN